MLSELITSIRSSLLTVGVHRTKVQLHRQLKSGEVLRVLTGVYLPVESFEGHPLSEYPQIALIARLSAFSIRHPRYVLSGASAGILLGLPTSCRIKDTIAYSPTQGGARKVLFPPLRLPDGSKISGAMFKTSRPKHPIPSMEYLGFRVATPTRILIDCARNYKDAQSFPLVCAGLSRTSEFDRFHLKESRTKASSAREEILAELQQMPHNTPGRKQAKWIINHADAGCESPGEALVLLALLRAGIIGISTQEEVHIDGRTYFIDIALADLKIAIEFDGRIKYGETIDQVHDSIEAEQRRQRDLERAGWKVIRVRWSDLKLIDEVVAQVLVAIRAQRTH